MVRVPIRQVGLTHRWGAQAHKGRAPPSEHFLDSFRPLPPLPLPNHLEPGQSPTWVSLPVPAPWGETPLISLEPRQAERVPEPDSRVLLELGEMGRALFALISRVDVERVGLVPGPHCIGVIPLPGDPAVRPHHLPVCPWAPSPPHAPGFASFLLGTL